MVSSLTSSFVSYLPFTLIVHYLNHIVFILRCWIVFTVFTCSAVMYVHGSYFVINMFRVFLRFGKFNSKRWILWYPNLL